MSHNSPDIKSVQFPVKVVSNKAIAKGVYVLSFSRKLDFIPGQMLSIQLDEAEDSRLYSIASGNNDPLIEILYNIKDEGYLTPRLADVKQGESILVSRPFGTFLVSEDPAFWIASGTGVAPFASMMRSGYSENKMLIHGGRKYENFYFQDEFLEIMNGRYIRCATSDSSEGLYAGRLTEYLRNKDDLPLDHKYYLCGMTEMVIEVREILVKKGIPFEQIQSEIYF